MDTLGGEWPRNSDFELCRVNDLPGVRFQIRIRSQYASSQMMIHSVEDRSGQNESACSDDQRSGAGLVIV